MEDSYRRQGVERGWLKPDYFVRLSRQALGIGYMESCKRNPLSWCPGNEVKVMAGTARTAHALITLYLSQPRSAPEPFPD